MAKQIRAQVTRESIVEAGLLILRDLGIQDYNTNKIAEVAGVSVGSLYQYFPNKKSILKFILLKKIQNDIISLGSLIQSIQTDSPKVLLQVFTANAWDSFLVSREMCRELYLAAESYEDHLDIIKERKKIIDIFADRLHSLMPSKNKKAIQLKTQLITDSFMGVMQTLVFDDELFESNEILKANFIQMVESTLLEVGDNINGNT